MKKPSRFLRVLGAAGLLISLLAATIAPVAAQDEGEGDLDFLDDLISADGAGFLAGNNSIYYPWVANGDDFGLGPSQTSISIQNLEDIDTVISIFVGNADGSYDLVTGAYLSAYASKTFSAAALGIADGSGAPVAVFSFNEVELAFLPDDDEDGIPEEVFEDLDDEIIALVETPILLSNPIADDEGDGENDGGDATQVEVCVVNAHSASQPGLGQPLGYVDAESGEWVTFSTQEELQETLNAANAGNDGELINPFGGLNNDGDCFDVLDAETLILDDSVAIGGVAKQTAEAAAPAPPEDDEGEDGENGEDVENGEDTELEQLTTTDTAVSGYNAVNGAELYYFGEWYLPIVQTNCGPGGCWDSMLRIANFDAVNNAVTVRFFPADDGSGSLQEGFQLQALIDGGDTWHINLGDYVPDEWVGSAHIYSDGAVFAMVDRYKVGYNMWITNTGSSADFEVDYDGDGDLDEGAQIPNRDGRYALFAPHVLLDYFGWNTGINVANLVNTDNNVSIQYFNLLGNATQVLNQRLAAHGMTYFYDPSVAAQDGNQDVTTDPNAGIVGSALIWSDFPVAAAVDATKYPETDPNGGADVFQATSYSATANVFPWQAVPLVQKGNATDGSGATSGINIMNPNDVAATADVYWVNPSGFLADNFGVSSVTIPAFANGFVYTLWQNNLPNGFEGAAQVVANVPVAAVSANVNYDVEGDGGAMFNAFNPCGLYRVSGPCTFGDVLEPGGQSVTKTFVDEGFDAEDTADDTGVAGVNFSITSTSDAGYQRDGVSGVDGSTTFSNVPVGTYELTVNDVPDAYVLPEGVQETIVVTEGEDVVLENPLEWNQTINKTVCVDVEALENEDGDLVDEEGDVLGDDEDPILVCEEDTVLGGVGVAIYEIIGLDDDDDPVVSDELVFLGTTNADGMVSLPAAPGDYALCLYEVEDGEITLPGGEVVEPDGLAPEEWFFEEGEEISECFEQIDLGDVEGEIFEVGVGETVNLHNEVEIEATINGFVGDLAAAVAGATLQEHADELTPVAGVNVCIESDDDFDYDECATSDADGNIEFPEAPGGYYQVYNFQFPDGVTFECVEGSDSLEWENAPLCGEETENQSQLAGTGYDFYYDPVEDVVQGDSDDDASDDGVYDATLQVDVDA